MDEAQSEEAGGFSFSPKESSALGSSGPPAARLETDGEAPDVGRLLEALSVGRTLWDHGAQADGPPHAHPAPLHTGLWLGESAPRARAARERDTGCWEPADPLLLFSCTHSACIHVHTHTHTCTRVHMNRTEHRVETPSPGGVWVGLSDHPSAFEREEVMQGWKSKCQL